MRAVFAKSLIGLTLFAVGCCCGGAPSSNAGAGAGSAGTSWVQDGDSVRLVLDDSGTSAAKPTANSGDKERCLWETEACSEACDKKYTIDSMPYSNCQDECWAAKLACQDACPTCYTSWQQAR